MNLALAVSLALAASGSAPGAAPATPEQPPAVVARVDGAPITLRDLEERLAMDRGTGLARPALQALSELVDEAVLAEEFDRRRLHLPAGLAGELEERRRALGARRYLERALAGIEPDDAQLRALFHLNADSANVRLVVLATRAEAAAALDRLAHGAPFAEEARRSLQEESARRGGSLGTRTRAQLPGKLGDAVFAAPLGQVVGPVELELGWGLLQVTERSIGTDAEFSARRAEIAAFARRQDLEAARRHLVAQLRARAGVTVDEPFLAATGASVEPRDLDHVVAAVPGRPVRYGDVLDLYRRTFGPGAPGHGTGPSLKTALAGQLVDERLLEAEGARAGLDRGPAADAALAATTRRAEAIALTQLVRDGVPAPDDGAVEGFYRSHLSDYRVAPSRRCRALVVRSEGDARDALRRIEGGAPFEAVARERSADPRTAAAGGDLGTLDLDALARLEDDPAQAPLVRALRSAPAERLVGPLEIARAFYLLRCDAVVPAHPRPLAEIRADVAARARADAQVRASDALLARLRAAAAVTLDRTAAAAAVPASP